MVVCENETKNRMDDSGFAWRMAAGCLCRGTAR